MFGTIGVVAVQDIGGLGPCAGQPVAIECPIVDSLRSACLWAPLFVLLLRKPNRTLRAWSVLAPLLVIYVILGLAEGMLNDYFVFHYHQQMCSIMADLLRFFALGVAIYLAMCDVLSHQRKPIRFLSCGLVLFLAGGASINQNAWATDTAHSWTCWFAASLLWFMASHSLVAWLLGKAVPQSRFSLGYAAFCVAFGLAPTLTLGIVESRLYSFSQSQDVFEAMRSWIIRSAALCLPYFVLFWFVVWARLVPFYGQRFEIGFGVKVDRRPSITPGQDAVATVQ